MLTNYHQLIIKRHLTETLLVTIIQYVGLMTSTLLISPSPIWLGSGTACAFIFLRGYSVLPGVLLGTALAFLFAGAPAKLAITFAILLLLQTILIFFITERFISPSLIFYRRKLFFSYFMICLITTGMTAEISKLFLPLHGVLQNWLANFNGVLIISLTFAAIDAYFPQFNRWREELFGFNFITIILCIFLISFLINFCLYLQIPIHLDTYPQLVTTSLAIATSTILFLLIKQ